eukprot:948125-Pelagomonas_calceolata.AAC.3
MVSRSLSPECHVSEGKLQSGAAKINVHALLLQETRCIINGIMLQLESARQCAKIKDCRRRPSCIPTLV